MAESPAEYMFDLYILRIFLVRQYEYPLIYSRNSNLLIRLKPSSVKRIHEHVNTHKNSNTTHKFAQDDFFSTDQANTRVAEYSYADASATSLMRKAQWNEIG